MSALVLYALFGVASLSPAAQQTTQHARLTPAALEAACTAQLAQNVASESSDTVAEVELTGRELLALTSVATTPATSALDPILCAAVIAAKSAACCAACKAEYPFEWIKSCGWSGGCVRGECVCEHYPL